MFKVAPTHVKILLQGTSLQVLACLLNLRNDGGGRGFIANEFIGVTSEHCIKQVPLITLC
jgi:hypothetical protein